MRRFLRYVADISQSPRKALEIDGAAFFQAAGPKRRCRRSEDKKQNIQQSPEKSKPVLVCEQVVPKRANQTSFR